MVKTKYHTSRLKSTLVTEEIRGGKLLIETLLKRKMKTTRKKPRTRTNLPPLIPTIVKRTKKTPLIQRKMDPKLRINFVPLTKKQRLKIKRIFENVSNILPVYMI